MAVELSELQAVTLTVLPREACAIVQMLRMCRELLHLHTASYGADGTVQLEELREKLIEQVEAQRKAVARA